jgi:hypothetical protein
MITILSIRVVHCTSHTLSSGIVNMYASQKYFLDKPDFLNRREMNFSTILYLKVSISMLLYDVHEVHVVGRTRTNLKVYSQTSTVMISMLLYAV